MAKKKPAKKKTAKSSSKSSPKKKAAKKSSSAKKSKASAKKKPAGKKAAPAKKKTLKVAAKKKAAPAKKKTLKVAAKKNTAAPAAKKPAPKTASRPKPIKLKSPVLVEVVETIEVIDSPMQSDMNQSTYDMLRQDIISTLWKNDEITYDELTGAMEQIHGKNFIAESHDHIQEVLDDLSKIELIETMDREEGRMVYRIRQRLGEG